MASEQIRIGPMTTAERRLIHFLTPEERKNVLIEEAKKKMKRDELEVSPEFNIYDVQGHAKRKLIEERV